MPDVFKDFKPKGGDHVFEDLDRAMKKMEHWAHRLYPKLPFDDTMARISVLGKKMAVSVIFQTPFHLQNFDYTVNQENLIIYAISVESLIESGFYLEFGICDQDSIRFRTLFNF